MYKDPSTLFIKVYRVVHSCKTISQFVSARQYANLYIKQLSKLDQEIFLPKILELLNSKLERFHKHQRSFFRDTK